MYELISNLLEDYNIQDFQLDKINQILYREDNIIEVALYAKQIRDKIYNDILVTVIGDEGYGYYFIWCHTSERNNELERNEYTYRNRYLPLEMYSIGSMSIYKDETLFNELNCIEEKYTEMKEEIIEYVNSTDTYKSIPKEDIIHLKDIWENELDNFDRVEIYSRMNKDSLEKFEYSINSRRIDLDFRFPIKINNIFYGYALSFNENWRRTGNKTEWVLLAVTYSDVNLDQNREVEWRLPILSYINEIYKVTGDNVSILREQSLDSSSDMYTCLATSLEGDNINQQKREIYTILKEVIHT